MTAGIPCPHCGHTMMLITCRVALDALRDALTAVEAEMEARRGDAR